MYFTTPFNRVLALDPETGKQKWSFDPNIDLRAPYSEGLINRGVALWSDSATRASTSCRFRIFFWQRSTRVYLPSMPQRDDRAHNFGTEGTIDLAQGVANITRRGEYEETSAPAVAGDLVIVRSSIADQRSGQ